MAARRTVVVQVLGHEYRIKGESDPEGVRRAARLLEETVERVQRRSRTVDSLDVAVLAALNLAHGLVSARDAAQGAAPEAAAPPLDPERVEALVELLESAVGGAAAP